MGGEMSDDREEDWAYSLLGIFDVFIAPIYGEWQSLETCKWKARCTADIE